MHISLGNIVLYILIINLLGYTLMWHDKKSAQKGEWRVKEKTLFLVAAIGGSIGSIIGMYHFRHKTKHSTFTVGMPAILILQITIFVLYKLELIDDVFNALKSFIL